MVISSKSTKAIVRYYLLAVTKYTENHQKGRPVHCFDKIKIKIHEIITLTRHYYFFILLNLPYDIEKILIGASHVKFITFEDIYSAKSITKFFFKRAYSNH